MQCNAAFWGLEWEVKRQDLQCAIFALGMSEASGFDSNARLGRTGHKERWSRLLRQPVKVDLTTQRTIHHEDAETIFG